jgi:hypothetical protein
MSIIRIVPSYQNVSILQRLLSKAGPPASDQKRNLPTRYGDREEQARRQLGCRAQKKICESTVGTDNRPTSTSSSSSCKTHGAALSPGYGAAPPSHYNIYCAGDNARIVRPVDGVPHDDAVSVIASLVLVAL